MVGHIRYANHVHDALLLAGLNGSELHAALVCYRAARGWGGLESKQVPWPMSAGLVVQSTTLKRSVAARALAGLRSKGIIVEHEPPRGPRPALYLFVERPDEWTVNLVSTERDIHGAGHKPPLSGTQVSTQRDSGVHSAGQSADENAVQQRKTAPPKTETTVRQEDNHSARAREGVTLERRDPVASASDRRHKRLQTEAQAAPNGGTSVSERRQYAAENSDGPSTANRVHEPPSPEAGGAIPADLPAFRVIQGTIPADPAFTDWESLEPKVIIEVDGRREGLDWMAAGLTLRDVLCPPAPEPVPEPEPEPPFLEALMGAIRGAVDEWTERAMQQGRGAEASRAEREIGWKMQDLMRVADNAGPHRATLLQLARDAGKADRSPVRYFLACLDKDGRPKPRNKRRAKAQPYTYRRTP